MPEGGWGRLGAAGGGRGGRRHLDVYRGGLLCSEAAEGCL